jgi:hypothetical protein
MKELSVSGVAGDRSSKGRDEDERGLLPPKLVARARSDSSDR